MSHENGAVVALVVALVVAVVALWCRFKSQAPPRKNRGFPPFFAVVVAVVALFLNLSV